MARIFGGLWEFQELSAVLAQFEELYLGEVCIGSIIYGLHSDLWWHIYQNENHPVMFKLLNSILVVYSISVHTAMTAIYFVCEIKSCSNH